MQNGLTITWISLVLNLLLGAAKVITGLLAGSSALVADGLHSLLDLLSDIAVIVGLMIAGRPEDANHPYGHHKFASFAKFFIGGSLILFSVLLLVSALSDLHDGLQNLPAGPALLVALVSLLIKEGLYWWTRSAALRLKSDLIMANAWHHRTDSISSLAVAVALFGIWMGGADWAFLDRAVTLVLGSYLLFESYKIFRGACADLLDTAPEQEIIDDLSEHILPTPGVIAYHEFRVRRLGDRFEVDLHLQVDSTITVGEGHAIAKAVKQTVLSKHPEVFKILVHVEPAEGKHLQPRGVSDGTAEPPASGGEER